MRMNTIKGAEWPTRKNEVWCVDYTILDVAHRPIVLIAIDVFSRVPMLLHTTTQYAADIFKLDQAGRRSGYPERLWIDQAYEFRSQHLHKWADLRGVELVVGDPLRKKCVSERFLCEMARFVGDNASTKPGDLQSKLAELQQSYKAAAAAIH